MSCSTGRPTEGDPASKESSAKGRTPTLGVTDGKCGSETQESLWGF